MHMLAVVKVGLKKSRSSVTRNRLQTFTPKILVTFFSRHRFYRLSHRLFFLTILMTCFFSHCRFFMTFFAHYLHLLRICTLTPLPSLTQLQNSPLHTHTWWSAALEKLEAAERRSDALRLTLTTASGQPDDSPEVLCIICVLFKPLEQPGSSISEVELEKFTQTFCPSALFEAVKIRGRMGGMSRVKKSQSSALSMHVSIFDSSHSTHPSLNFCTASKSAKFWPKFGL